MKKTGRLLKTMAYILLVPMLLISGCSQKEQKPEARQQSMQDAGSPEESSEQLEEIEESIEKIIMVLDGPSAEAGKDRQDGAKEEKTVQEQQSQQQSGSEHGGEKNQQEGAQKEQQSQGQQKGQTSQQSQKDDPWSEISLTINKLHYQWNDYMPQAVKLGANQKLVEAFSDALNSLTSTIIGKNKTNTLMAASYLYAYIPDFYSLYKAGVSPEIKRVKYYTRNAMLNALTANWEQADFDMNSLKSSWSMFRNTLANNHKENTEKLDFSIYELEKAIIERNQPLTDIKGRVAMSNIQSLESDLEKEKIGGQQGIQRDGQQSGQ